MTGIAREATSFAHSTNLNRSPQNTIMAIVCSALIALKFHEHFIHMPAFTMLSRRYFVSLEVLEHYSDHSAEISSYLRQCHLILLLFNLKLALKKF